MEALTPEVVTEFDRPGPRYTSYPTANMFSARFDANECVAALRGRAPGPLTLYVHLPFCERLCTYCACNVLVRRNIGPAGDRYVGQLLSEAAAARKRLQGEHPVVELQLGGGTPNYLSRAQLARLLGGLRRHFQFSDDALLGIEVDPRHVDDGDLAWLFAEGFRRVSLGIQDVDPRVQEAIGREQSLAQTRAAFDAARSAGFRSVNMDLVYGLPAQNPESFRLTVDSVIAMNPDRLAMFSFAYLPEVKAHQRKLDASLLPDRITKATLLVDAVQRFKGAGYVQVGIDHYARPDDSLAQSFAAGTLARNFQGYVPGPRRDVLGLGVSAVSDVGSAYWQNHHKLGPYGAAVERQWPAAERGWTSSHEDRLRRAVIESIMCRFKVDYSELESGYGIEHDTHFEPLLPRLKELEADGLLCLDAAGSEATELGRLFARNIAMTYDAYLGTRPANFSRTV